MIYGVWDVSWLSYARYVWLSQILYKKHIYPSLRFYSIICEFILQGGALFQTHENLEHLAMMERVLGPLPQPMLKRVE